MALPGLIFAFGVATLHAEQVASPPTTIEATEPVPAGATLADDDPWSSPEVAAPRMDSRPLERGARGGSLVSATARDGEGGGSTWVRTTMALGGVIGLIMLLAWGYRRVADSGKLGFALRPRHAAPIEVVARTPLSPRQSLCLVRIGPRLVLVGCTPDSVRALDVIQDDDLAARLAGQAIQRRPDSHTAEFARCLEREAGAYGGERESGSAAEEAVPEHAQLRAVQDALGGTIRRLRATLAQA